MKCEYCGIDPQSLEIKCYEEITCCNECWEIILNRNTSQLLKEMIKPHLADILNKEIEKLKKNPELIKTISNFSKSDVEVMLSYNRALDDCKKIWG